MYSISVLHTIYTWLGSCYTIGVKTKQTQDKKASQTIAWQNLTPEQEKEFYKLLVTHNYAEAAAQIGMDAFYSGDGLRRVGYQIYQRLDVSKLGIDQDLQDMVTQAIEARKIFKGRKPENQEKLPAEQEFTPAELLDPKDTKQLVLGGRNKAAILLHKKFDLLNKNKQALKDTSLSQLGTVFGILFDKSQIIQGEATEHVAVMSKNIKDMNPEESLDAILRMREEEIASKAEQA
jgi:hypothetical protein